jgi:putative ABC transport system ATP-binding protein
LLEVVCAKQKRIILNISNVNKKEIAKVVNANKIYKTGDTTITALNPSSLSFYAGELVLIIGPSGSGKTTLLSILGCVTYPTNGDVFINGIEVSKLSETKLGKIRLENIGFVFQGYNLIAPLNALENVMLPLELMNRSAKEAKQKAITALQKVNMQDRLKNLPKALSGGQQQRVAIARALVTDPSLILCDEPTASLDPASVDIVMQELKALVSDNKCVVIVTHDMRLRSYADRIVYVDNGNVLTEEPKNNYSNH